MRAADLHEAPGDLVIEDLDIASPTGREVLIHTRASGLCHSDLHVIEGLLPLPSLPAALSHATVSALTSTEVGAANLT